MSFQTTLKVEIYQIIQDRRVIQKAIILDLQTGVVKQKGLNLIRNLDIHKFQIKKKVV